MVGLQLCALLDTPPEEKGRRPKPTPSQEMPQRAGKNARAMAGYASLSGTGDATRKNCPPNCPPRKRSVSAVSRGKPLKPNDCALLSDNIKR